MLIGRGARSVLARAFFFACVLEAMLVPAILYWPDFRKNIGALKAMAPIAVLKDMVSGLEAGGVVAYVTGQHYFKGCNTLGTAAAVLFAMGAVAGEVHRGTLELMLSRPLTRRRILIERYVQGALAVVLPVFATSLTIPWLLSRVGESMEYWPLVLSSAHQSLLLLAIYSATFLLSAIGSNPTPIAFAMLFFSTFQFAIYLVQKWTHYSLFRLADFQEYVAIFARERLDVSVVLPLLGVSVVCLVASMLVFERRVP